MFALLSFALDCFVNTVSGVNVISSHIFTDDPFSFLLYFLVFGLQKCSKTGRLRLFASVYEIVTRQLSIGDE